MRFRKRALIALAFACIGFLPRPTVGSEAKFKPEFSLGDVVNSWQPPQPGPRPPLVEAEYKPYQGVGSGAIHGTAVVHFKNGEVRACRPGVAPVEVYPATEFVAWMLKVHFLKTRQTERYQRDPIMAVGGPDWLGSNGASSERGSLVRRGTCSRSSGFVVGNLPPGKYYVFVSTETGSFPGSTDVSVGSGITPSGPGLVTIYGPYSPGPPRDCFEMVGGPYTVTTGAIDVGNLTVAAHYAEER